MSTNLISENMSLREQLSHANQVTFELMQQIERKDMTISQWKDAYNDLKKTHASVVESKKKDIDRIKRKARQNPWPWVASAICLIAGLLGGMCL
jgi:ElaB/YqjD/DUF883 family membrane-anchored ribosome-binding protein